MVCVKFIERFKRDITGDLLGIFDRSELKRQVNNIQYDYSATTGSFGVEWKDPLIRNGEPMNLQRTML